MLPLASIFSVVDVFVETHGMRLYENIEIPYLIRCVSLFMYTRGDTGAVSLHHAKAWAIPTLPGKTGHLCRY